MLGQPQAGGLSFDRGERLDVHDEDRQAVECFLDRLQLGLLRLVRVSHPTDNPMGYILGEVVRDFLVRPVAIHALRGDDQGEVDLTTQVQVADGVDKHLGLAGTHLRKECVGISIDTAVKSGHLMCVGFGFEFVVDSHWFLLYGHNLRTTSMFVNPET